MTDPLHGLTLKHILTSLVDFFGFEELGRRIKVRCFNNDPSIKSSLTFLRKNLWAREQVEDLYLEYQKKIEAKVAKGEDA